MILSIFKAVVSPENGYAAGSAHDNSLDCWDSLKVGDKLGMTLINRGYFSDLPKAPIDCLTHPASRYVKRVEIIETV